MLTAFVLAALAAPSAAAAPPPPRPPLATCDKGFSYAGTEGANLPPQVRKLGDLPPANLYLSVQRHVGGCPAPAIVKTGIGGLK